MECKFCHQQMDEGSTLCPHCGKDNAVEVTEETTEIKKGITTISTRRLTVIIIGVVVMTAVVVALIMQGMGAVKPSVEDTQPADTVVSDTPGETVAAATLPAGTGENNETCKGSYTVSDEAVIAAMDRVVATIGDTNLTNADLQIYYWMQVQQFVGNYGSYAAYFGLDLTQPLDTQVCMLEDTGITWQQYFLKNALQTWHNYRALANESLALGFELDEEYRTMIDGIPTSLETDAGLQGFANAEEFLAYNVGRGCTIAEYVRYMETYYQGYLYFESEYSKMKPTAEEIESYFAEHEAEYAQEGVTKDTKYVDARHILVFPEGENEDGTYSEEAWEACRQKAQEILDAYLAGEATEESFAALANEKSEDPGSNTNGGLYEDMYEGQMVEPFENWCFDEERKYGDTGLVQTSYGYHIMFYVGSHPVWDQYAMEDLISERANELVMATMEKHPMVVDYNVIELGYVNMGA